MALYIYIFGVVKEKVKTTFGGEIKRLDVVDQKTRISLISCQYFHALQFWVLIG